MNEISQRGLRESYSESQKNFSNQIVADRTFCKYFNHEQIVIRIFKGLKEAQHRDATVETFIMYSLIIRHMAILEIFPSLFLPLYI